MRDLRQYILPFYLPSALFALSEALLVPVLPIFVTEFGAPYALIGVVLAGQGLGTLLSDLPAGMLHRRLGSKRLIALGLVISAVATALLFLAPNLLTVFALRLASGVGRSFFGMGRHNFAAEGMEKAIRGRAIAALGGALRVGGFLGPALGGALGAALGLRSVFLLFGVLTGIAALVSVLLLPTDAPTTAPIGVRAQAGRLFSTMWDFRALLGAAGAGQLFAMTIRTGRRVIIPLYAADVLGLGVQQIGLIESLAMGVDASLFFGAGLLMDRFGRKAAIVPTFALQALGMALVPLTGGFVTLLGAAVLIGVGNGLSSGTMMTVGADLAPEAQRGEFLGAWRLIGDTGFMLGPLVTGTVADLLVLPAAALVLAGSGGLAALTFALFVPETLQPEPATEGAG